MKFLFDQNLSPRLVDLLSDSVPTASSLPFLDRLELPHSQI